MTNLKLNITMAELIFILTPLLRLVVVAFFVVFAAMSIDLLVGLHKSREKTLG